MSIGSKGVSSSAWRGRGGGGFLQGRAIMIEADAFDLDVGRFELKRCDLGTGEL